MVNRSAPPRWVLFPALTSGSSLNFGLSISLLVLSSMDILGNSRRSAPGFRSGLAHLPRQQLIGKTSTKNRVLVKAVCARRIYQVEPQNRLREDGLRASA